jgi:hypothetical protein
MTKVVLKRPIQAHGEEVKELTFREPMGADIIACGYPLLLGNDTVTPEAGAIAKYISRLADIPAGAVAKLSASDFNNCWQAIIPFFKDGGESPAPASED